MKLNVFRVLIGCLAAWGLCLEECLFKSSPFLNWAIVVGGGYRSSFFTVAKPLSRYRIAHIFSHSVVCFSFFDDVM